MYNYTYRSIYSGTLIKDDSQIRMTPVIFNKDKINLQGPKLTKTIHSYPLKRGHFLGSSVVLFKEEVPLYIIFSHWNNSNYNIMRFNRVIMLHQDFFVCIIQ